MHDIRVVERDVPVNAVRLLDSLMAVVPLERATIEEALRETLAWRVAVAYGQAIANEEESHVIEIGQEIVGEETGAATGVATIRTEHVANPNPPPTCNDKS